MKELFLNLGFLAGIYVSILGPQIQNIVDKIPPKSIIMILKNIRKSWMLKENKWS
jgi:hypothetical protein